MARREAVGQSVVGRIRLESFLVIISMVIAADKIDSSGTMGVG
jgi:hypothetical protein